jgi:hypothetical protein
VLKLVGVVGESSGSGVTAAPHSQCARASRTYRVGTCRGSRHARLAAAQPPTRKIQADGPLHLACAAAAAPTPPRHLRRKGSQATSDRTCPHPVCCWRRVERARSILGTHLCPEMIRASSTRSLSSICEIEENESPTMQKPPPRSAPPIGAALDDEPSLGTSAAPHPHHPQHDSAQCHVASLPFSVGKQHMDQIVRDSRTHGDGAAFSAVTCALFLAAVRKLRGLRGEATAWFSLPSPGIDCDNSVILRTAAGAYTLQVSVACICNQLSALLPESPSAAAAREDAENTSVYDATFIISAPPSKTSAAAPAPAAELLCGAPISLVVEQRRVQGELRGTLVFDTSVISQAQAVRLLQDLTWLHSLRGDQWLAPLPTTAPPPQPAAVINSIRQSSSTPTGHVLSQGPKTCAGCKRSLDQMLMLPGGGTIHYGFDRMFCSEFCRDKTLELVRNAKQRRKTSMCHHSRGASSAGSARAVASPAVAAKRHGGTGGRCGR